MSRTVTLETRAEDAGERLDRFLTGRLDGLSRSRIHALLAAGEIRESSGAAAPAPSNRVRPGQRFVVHLPAPAAALPEPEARPLEVVFEDEHLLVLAKPAGLVVHPAPGHAAGTLVNALLAHCAGSLSGIGGVARPGIVHRLDKDVSGLLVVAKHDRAHVGLAGQFAVHSVERAYEAVVLGTPPARAGLIDAPIGRHPRNRKRMAVVASGKPAKTKYRVLDATGSGLAWLRLDLMTGRTHQIRVHLQSIGLGIVGDPLYRPPRAQVLPEILRVRIAGFGRIALHARTLGFKHPLSEQRLAFDLPPPSSFAELLKLAT
ncbi:MAG: RluA family pseudouridine synthase [Geminicoccaceae bacterium]|nr:RluA family pseudouridine synthase [Geminicoccaceae bacterium]